jgi:hypothetical protein
MWNDLDDDGLVREYGWSGLASEDEFREAEIR